jgi:hypothetical protein
MVTAFLKHILCVNCEDEGLWGKTDAYYGTVEEQGRLTLHLHLLLWIENSLTPQEIRDKVMDPNSEFQKELVEYLENMHQGHFLGGTMEDIRQHIDLESKPEEYKDPIMTMPEEPPMPCKHHECNKCSDCTGISQWWQRFRHTVDDLICRTNRHSCSWHRCKKNKWKKCKSRFPCPLSKDTMVDPHTGYLNICHGEAQLNTFHTVLSYVLHCNSDVTSLLSGTAIKAVIAYVTDYVAKYPVKTYSIFQTIKEVFD